MYRICLAILGCLLLACTGNNERGNGNKKTEDRNTLDGFSNQFTAVPVPYQLSDTVLLDNKDTTTLSAPYLETLVPDSITQKIFGKKAKVRYTPLAKVEAKNKESYYIIKAAAGNKKAALLLVFNEKGEYGATFPFLVPDDKPSTSQTSSLDKSFAISKSITERNGTDVIGEGKEVLAYDAKTKSFSLVMTDLLNDNPAVLVNPIDTFPKTNGLAGDYYLNKKSLIAVRDGRHANQILVFIHTEKSDGDCKGELKGEFILTSTTTAVYRQGGDPCVLGLTFTGNSVSMKEESGCGNYRGLDCPFSGSFTRKKEEKPKEINKPAKRQKQT